MFDIGGIELLVIAIVAIVVVGPKDLPRMLRAVGQFVGKAKMMAREFQSHFNDAMNDAGIDDVRKEISKATSGSGMRDTLKPFTDAGNEIKREIETPAATASKSPTRPEGRATGPSSAEESKDTGVSADKGKVTDDTDGAKAASS